MSSAGRIAIVVWEPYPAWCEISIDGEKVAKLHHRELADLKYVTEQAMKKARLLLGTDRDEV